MTYQILVDRSARQALRRIQRADVDNIRSAIDALANDPRPSGCKKLSGREAWRIRVGNYRIIYTIHDQQLIVTIIAVGHRRDIYR